MGNTIQKRKQFRLLLLILFFPFCAFAQSVSVSGVVKDESGDVLIGVTIVESGTTNGTITDADGKYQITVASNAKLTFSFIGYQTTTMEVRGRKTIDLVLKEDTKALEEVVVVGYGTMKKKDLTGAVTSVKSDAIAKSVPTSIDQVLQGRAAGVQVQQNSGMPGASASIRIRGINSLNSSNEPMYVIDGVVISGGGIGDNDTNTNALANINPADIVTLDILKDASATAIYGSRAANGVIIITTKRGQKGEAAVSYNGYIGWQQIPKKLDLLDLPQYAANINVLAQNGIANSNSNFVRPDLLGPGTDWQSELFNTAMMHSHNVSISGAGDKTTYAMGAGYMNQEGIAAGSGFRRLNLSGNFDSQVKTWLKSGVNFAFANTHQKLTVSDQSLILTAMRVTPNVPVRNVDGTFAASDDNQYIPVNPMAMAALIDNSLEIADLRANAYAEATLIPGLTYRTELSFDINTNNTAHFEPTWYLSRYSLNNVSSGRYTKQYNKYWNWNNVLTYNKTFGEQHTLTAMLGQEMSKSTWDYLMGSRTGFLTNSSHALRLGDQKTADDDGYDGMAGLMSYFGRVFYSFDDRYLLTATLRRDGSSKFAKNKRWGTFPSVAVAWKLSNESFLKDNPVIDNLKLRFGYGLVGNQNIPVNEAYIAAYGVNPSNWGAGLLAGNMPNPDLTWESTSSSNVGIDLNLFKNRIEFIADLYYKKTKNLLMQSAVPAFTGTNGQGSYQSPWVNVGSLQNKGIELTLNTVNLDIKNFMWRSNFVFSLNRNKVLSINTPTGIITRSVSGNAYGVTEDVTINRSMVGRPIGEFYGYQVIGRFEKATDFYRYNEKGDVVRTPVMFDLPIDERSGIWIGDYIYKDQLTVDTNSDGIPDAGDGVIDMNDRTAIGNPEPKFTFGIGNTFSYKGFDLTIQLSGVYGNDVVNYTRRFMENPFNNSSNLFTSALNYAKLGLIDENGPNDYRNVHIIGGDSHAPRLPLGKNASDYDFAFSDRFVEDGSYLRIQNISFGYNLPQSLISKAGIQSLKIYTNIQNLYTFTKYKGYDPEIGSTYIDGNWVSGFDSGRYPSPRIYTVGLNVTF
ncbi:MAG: TonB-dependent receptor [Candidatus Azobacteroides sp.]|nr:TonB-dependent receptor [Candidatus Azobacteroides sp.]